MHRTETSIEEGFQDSTLLSTLRSRITTRSVARALAGPITMVVALVVMSLATECAVRIVIDDGMNFGLEMWKYSLRIKQASANPLLGHAHRPNASAHLMGVDLVTNSRGYRNRELSDLPEPGVKRIVMLGDSFVEGWGVPSEDTVSKQLERMFTHGSARVEVVNTGVGNYNTVMEVESFLTQSVRLRPVLVVLNFTVNDAEPVPSYDSINFFTRNSEAAVFVAGSVDSALRLWAFRKPWDKYYLSLYTLPGWGHAKDAIHKLSVNCRAQGMKLVIVSWPELHSLRPYPLQKITDLVHQVANTEGIPFVDLLDAVRNEPPMSLCVTRLDPHPNSRANLLYSDYLYPRIARLLGFDIGKSQSIQHEGKN